ncbi:MAG: threonine/serine exporter family protein [Anaerovoracaceae bacterium]
MVKLGLGDNEDKIMIGGIMLLIPGIAMTNSLRDMLTGDIATGLLRLVNSLLLAASIACGFALPLILTGGSGI